MEIADPIPAIAAILEIISEMRRVLGLRKNGRLVAQVIDLVGEIIPDHGSLPATWLHLHKYRPQVRAR